MEQTQLERLQSLLVRLKRNVRRHREKIGDIASNAWRTCRSCHSPHQRIWWRVSLMGCSLCRCGKSFVCIRSLGPTENRWSLVIPITTWFNGAAGRSPACRRRCHGQRRYSDLPGQWHSPRGVGLCFRAELIQASVIAEDPFHIDHQLAMLQNYRPTILITTPANALDLIKMMQERRIDPQSLHLRTVLLSRRWKRTFGIGCDRDCSQRYNAISEWAMFWIPALASSATKADFT